MISTKRELIDCLKADSTAYERVVITSYSPLNLLHKLRARYFTTPISDQYIIWKYICTLRKVEFYSNSTNLWHKLLLPFYVRRYMKLGRITGFQIPINSIKEGLTIWHYGMIIINQDTRIGRNCTLRPDIVLGHKDGEEKSPTIGDEVTINSGARIIGNVHIGDDVIVAPNAVVTRDVPSHCIVAGIPAKIIKVRKTINDKWESTK